MNWETREEDGSGWGGLIPSKYDRDEVKRLEQEIAIDGNNRFEGYDFNDTPNPPHGERWHAEKTDHPHAPVGLNDPILGLKKVLDSTPEKV